jgi:hypothetical protein
MHSIHNPWGVAMLLFLLLFFPCVGLWARVRNRRACVKLEEIAASKNFGLIDHVHEIRADRSDFTVTDDGNLFVRCCLAGCGEGVFIHADVACAWFGVKMQMPPEPVGPQGVLQMGRRTWI